MSARVTAPVPNSALEPFGVVERSAAVILVAMRCSSKPAADRHRDRWQRSGGADAQVDDVIVTGSFPSVFDALLAVGAIASNGEPIAAPGEESLVMVSGSAGPGIGGERLRARVAALLAAALPGQCLVSAEVALLAGPLLNASLDIVDSGHKESKPDRWDQTHQSGWIVYDIRPTDLAVRLDSCPRLEWARRRLHGAAVVPDGGCSVEDIRDSARIVSLVADDASLLEVAVARVALGAHSRGAHVLRTKGRSEGSPLLSAVTELLAAYADDRGSSLASEELAHEWAAVSRSAPKTSTRVGRDRCPGPVICRRYPDGDLDLLDLLDRLLRSIASTGPTVIVLSAEDKLDSLSCVLLERALGDRRLSGIRLVVGSICSESELVSRLRRRLGRGAIEQVRVGTSVHLV
ncbi:hypothetical protein [Rathayibacter rathayi]|uniref:hypothetical protein n=1 Tax=Rathayibacter rathayi TaxID=33887 RepID=UPI000BDBD3AF|nr:hypothetical protein [Rathayibacter rathayi]MWV75816.1 hypothetical protein [Rathayibacter rathayi NCPPB 2980 = VKM Ac-1601]SOE05819.1 hypothetical protein SAMN06295924_11516 [Rathayibacter rathayi NCPPB 2980 = VKM Ac-1601]